MFFLPDKIPRRRFFSAVKPGLKSIQNKNAKNKGQAIVEYILILTVVVTVMGALLLKLNRGIETWAKSLLGKGGYIACLMQTGTLPGKAHSSCFMKPIDADFSSSSSTGGTYSSSTGGTYSSSTGGTYSSSSTGGTYSSSTGGTYSSSTGGTYSSSTGGTYSSSSTGGGGSYSSSSTGGTDSSSSYTGSDGGKGGGDSNFSSESSANSPSSKSKTHTQNTLSGAGQSPSGELISLNSGNSLYGENIGAGEAEARARARARARGSKRKKSKKSGEGFRDGLVSSHNRSGRSGRRFRAVQSYGFISEDQKEQKKRITPIAVNGPISKKSRLRGNNKTSFLVQKKRKKKDKEVKIGKWSFGNTFRIILIICVIVAVVFLIGSQFTQVKKSMK